MHFVVVVAVAAARIYLLCRSVVGRVSKLDFSLLVALYSENEYVPVPREMPY